MNVKAIELILPGRNPTIVPIEAIVSVVFQAKAVNDEPTLIIGIQGWQKPFSYNGPQAKSLYDKIHAILAPETLKVD